jgi:hypothetical protein
MKAKLTRLGSRAAGVVLIVEAFEVGRISARDFLALFNAIVTSNFLPGKKSRVFDMLDQTHTEFGFYSTNSELVARSVGDLYGDEGLKLRATQLRKELESLLSEG